MSNTITLEQVTSMIRGSMDKIKANHQQLSKLDSVVGDGDHGSAMLRVAEAVSKDLDENRDGSLSSLLETIGWSVMGIDGGSTGPLMGAFFAGMGEALSDSEIIDGDVVASMFEGGLRQLRTLTKAQVGDKTMIDAFVPAVETLKVSIEAGQSVAQALEKASKAALEGANSTKDMQARFGRAKNLGARTIGHLDPGAMSVAYMFSGFCGAFSEADT